MTRYIATAYRNGKRYTNPDIATRIEGNDPKEVETRLLNELSYTTIPLYSFAVKVTKA